MIKLFSTRSQEIKTSINRELMLRMMFKPIIAENYIQNEIIVILLIGLSILILASYRIAKKAGMFSLYESRTNQRLLDDKFKRYYCPNCGRMGVSSRVPANCHRCSHEDLEITKMN